jgi:hypothetical protein
MLIQDDIESLQEFSTTVKQLTHCAFPALHEDHVLRGACKVFGKGMSDKGIKSSKARKEQEDTQWDPRADPRAGSNKADSQAFHWAPGNA